MPSSAMDHKEMRIRRRPRNLNMSLPSSALSFHNESRSSISKPTIRIIHIIAPEIIKTDTANFRDLVQRLTGKQPSTLKSCGRKINKLSTEKPTPRKTEHFDVKDEQGGYLKDFADLDDGFMHELRGISPTHVDAPLPQALL